MFHLPKQRVAGVNKAHNVNKFKNNYYFNTIDINMYFPNHKFYVLLVFKCI